MLGKMKLIIVKLGGDNDSKSIGTPNTFTGINRYNYISYVRYNLLQWELTGLDFRIINN